MNHMDKRVAIGMVAVAAAARLLPHPWNFTPMVAIGLYAGVQAAKLRTAILAPLAALLLSDAVMGFYAGMWYVYAAWLIPVLIGRGVHRNPSALNIAAGALCGSVSFFVTTNAAVWSTSTLYPHTLAGLQACFAAALPFYQNQLLGDAFYTVALFGGHALLIRLLQPLPRTA